MVCGATAQRRDSAALGATITPADSTDHALPRSSPSVGVRRRVRCFVATAPFDEQSPPLSHATAPSTSMVASRRSALLRDNRGASADPRRCRLPASVSHLLSPDGTSAARALVGWRHRSPRQPRPPVLPLTRRQSQRQDRASAPMPASRLDLRPPRCWQAPTGHERTRTSRRRLPLEQRPCQPILSSPAATPAPVGRVTSSALDHSLPPSFGFPRALPPRGSLREAKRRAAPPVLVSATAKWTIPNATGLSVSPARTL
ncbi:uncharacterized protein M6B38_160500 [Iris pallida]|uniref:Uncharacterized protein n=1 Tax=Iris pallida TaxID=29817 RepID=A0AAX6EYW4_IRIPA|nr:uncharacterized protein M6B38_160500 [Iris pallida]